MIPSALNLPVFSLFFEGIVLLQLQANRGTKKNRRA
jgi:hypothetical protein